MQVLSQIYYFVLKLCHSFLVKLLVLQFHLLLHEKGSVYHLVLFVIALQLIGENSCFFNQLIYCCIVTAVHVVLSQCLLIQRKALLEIREVVIALGSLTLQELYLVSLAFVGSQELLDIVAHVAIFHFK